MRGMLSVVLLTIPLLFLSGCSEKVVDGNILQDRGGLVDLPNEESPFTGTSIKRHDGSEQKESEGNLKDGVEDGIWTVWHENGQKESEGNLKDGVRDGVWTVWRENGQKESEGNYKDGVRQ